MILACVSYGFQHALHWWPFQTGHGMHCAARWVWRSPTDKNDLHDQNDQNDLLPVSISHNKLAHIAYLQQATWLKTHVTLPTWTDIYLSYTAFLLRSLYDRNFILYSSRNSDTHSTSCSSILLSTLVIAKEHSSIQPFSTLTATLILFHGQLWAIP